MAGMCILAETKQENMSENITVTLPKSEYDRLLSFEKAVNDSEKYRIVRSSGIFFTSTQYYLMTREEVDSELISELERLKKELAEEKAKKWYQKLF